MPKQDKFKNKLCDSKMTFEDCELTILRHALDNTEKQIGIEKVNNEDVKNMLQIVESFIKRKKLICYGGTAINNIYQKVNNFIINKWKYRIMTFFQIIQLSMPKN